MVWVIMRRRGVSSERRRSSCSSSIWSYISEILKLGEIREYLVAYELEKQQGSFSLLLHALHHFMAIGELKLEVQSGNAKLWSNLVGFFVSCDLEIWRRTLQTVWHLSYATWRPGLLYLMTGRLVLSGLFSTEHIFQYCQKSIPRILKLQKVDMWYHIIRASYLFLQTDSLEITVNQPDHALHCSHHSTCHLLLWDI